MKHGKHKPRGDAARSPHLDNLLDLDSRVDVHSLCHIVALAVDRAHGRALAQSGPPAGARGAERGGGGKHEFDNSVKHEKQGQAGWDHTNGHSV